MSAAVILSIPHTSNAADAEALRLEYGCARVVEDWHPTLPLQPDVLHITHMHPGDLEDWGIDVSSIKLRGWARAYAPMAQAGHIFAPLLSLVLSLFGAVLMAAILASSLHLDALSISDHSTELATAQDLEQAQRDEARRERMNQVYRAICGNAEWEELAGGAVRCLPRRGIKLRAVQLAGAQP